MALNTRVFESEFGFEIPPSLIRFFNDQIVTQKKPIRLGWETQEFVLELQYCLDISDSKCFDIKNKRIKIAVTTDGFDVLVDLGSRNLQVLQDEFGEIDELGLTMDDLNSSNKSFI